jgi:gluconolactonase
LLSLGRRLRAAAALALFVAGGGFAALAAGTLVTINSHSAYPEGAFVEDGVLYYTEMGNDRVMRWDGTANHVVWQRPGCYPTGIARGGSPDELIILCHREGALLRIGLDGETRAVIDTDENGRHFVTPNAVTNDARGGIYFSSSGDFAPTAKAKGAVLYLDATGRLRRLAEKIHYSNGVALSHDGRTLFVSEHLSRNVLAFDVAGDGSLSGRRIFVKLDDLEAADPGRGWEVGPDGLAVDRDDNLYLAEYGAGHLLIVDRDGKLLATVDVPEPYITSVAFSPDQATLYITAPANMWATGGQVYAVANPVRQGD